MTPTIEQEWEEFSAACGFADAHPSQKTGLKRAFFSGVYAALALLGNHGQVEPRHIWALLFDEAHRFLIEQVERNKGGRQ